MEVLRPHNVIPLMTASCFTQEQKIISVLKTQASGRERLMKSQGDCNVQTARTLRYDFSATDFDNNNNNNINK